LVKEPPVVAFVRGKNGQFVEVALEHLPADLRIVWLFYRAMYIYNPAGFAVDQRRGFHRLERVFRPLCVVLDFGDPIHTGYLDRLDIAGVVQFRR
jgi:hypothetical protein